jgi:hypothetical protein
MALAAVEAQVLLGQPEQIMLEEMAAQARPHLFLAAVLLMLEVAAVAH